MRQTTSDIPKFKDVKELVSEMFDTMYAANGIGLAAPQIGLSESIFIIEVERVKKTFINPKIIDSKGLCSCQEGCLSIPKFNAAVNRPSDILIEYFDDNWDHQQSNFDGMLARVILHEYDHLKGKLFIDYVNLKNEKALQFLREMKNGIYSAEYQTLQ